MRLETELYVLGACLLDNGYQKIADLLQPINFSTADTDKALLYDHQLIYTTMQQLYPTKPIDVLTVGYALPVGYYSYLFELTSRVSSVANIRYHAAILVEISIRETFIALLQTLQPNRTDIVRLALYEVQDEALDFSNDIFKVIETGTLYMQRMGDEAVHTALSDFNLKIDKRIAQIRQLAIIDSLMENLTNINHLAHEASTQMALAHLTDVIKLILAKGKLETQTLTNILSLKA